MPSMPPNRESFRLSTDSSGSSDYGESEYEGQPDNRMSIMSFIGYYEYFRPEKPVLKKAKSKKRAHPLKRIHTPYTQSPMNPNQNPDSKPPTVYQSYQPGVNAPPVAAVRSPRLQYPPPPPTNEYAQYG